MDNLSHLLNISYSPAFSKCNWMSTSQPSQNERNACSVMRKTSCVPKKVKLALEGEKERVTEMMEVNMIKIQKAGNCSLSQQLLYLDYPKTKGLAYFTFSSFTLKVTSIGSPV